MQNSLCCERLPVADRKRLNTVTYAFAVVYETCPMLVVAASWRILQRVMHDFSKTGLVHAKFRSLGTKRFANFEVFATSASWRTFRPARLAPSPHARETAIRRFGSGVTDRREGLPWTEATGPEKRRPCAGSSPSN
jgi:hypothetical protein